MTILKFLIWSKRPLMLEGLVDAVAVRPEAPLDFDVNDRMPDPRDLLRICSGLVMFVQRRHTIAGNDSDYKFDITIETMMTAVTDGKSTGTAKKR
jgi:hypothetical protein